MLDSGRLRVLLQVARTGSLAAAAEALGYTPSAVSQQIRALERELGTVLLDRRGRGVALTEPGTALIGHGQRIIDALGAAEAEVHAIAGLRAGVLRFGWFSTAGAILVPRAIAGFRQRHPEIELVLEEADPDECAHRLREGELDLAVVYEFQLDEPPSRLDARHLARRLSCGRVRAAHHLSDRRPDGLAGTRRRRRRRCGHPAAHARHRPSRHRRPRAQRPQPRPQAQRRHATRPLPAAGRRGHGHALREVAAELIDEASHMISERPPTEAS